MKARRSTNASKPKSQRSALKWMALLLVVSGVLRASDHIGVAYAEIAQTTAPASVARADQILGMPLDNQSLPILLETFRTREAALLENEAIIAAQRASLAEAEALIATQLAQLEAAEAKLQSTLAVTDSAAADDLARLAVVYENMKPRDTAALFSEMAPSFAAGFLGLMRPESSAAIMTELEPQTAHLISVMLAGRNAAAPGRE